MAQAELWLEPGANHSGVYDIDPVRYVDRLDTFFSGALDSGG